MQIKENTIMHSLEIAYTQHSGLQHAIQQDALWNGQEVFQSRNQPTTSISLQQPCPFFAVADGVSASPAPQLASSFVIEALTASLNKLPGAELDVRLVRRVHGLLCDRYARGRTFGSSTTLVATQIVGNRCIVANVGDSRAYRISADGSWETLSRDHTVIESLRQQGQASCDLEYAHIYDALDSCLIADDEETEFSVHRRVSPFQQGDSLLLCSDGLHQTLGQKILEQLFDPRHSTQAQVEIFRTAVLRAGAPDNFSLILVKHTGEVPVG